MGKKSAIRKHGRKTKRGIAMAMAVLLAVSGGVMPENIVINVKAAVTVTKSEDMIGIYVDENGIQYRFYGNDTCEIAGVNDKSVEKVILPSQIEYERKIYTVTSIGAWAFSNCEKLTDVEIPKSVNHIGLGVFNGCVKLTNIEIPECVTEIENAAFCDCSSLTNIIIPENVTSINYHTFYGCSSLINIEIPQSVVSIGEAAFEGTKWLENKKKENAVVIINNNLLAVDKVNCEGEVVIPEGVTNITDAFGYCTNLKSIKIPNSVENIAQNAFSGCNNLKKVEISDGVTSIEGNAFLGCSSLTSIKIPESVTKIGLYAFCGCSSLENIEIPSNITEIGWGAFLGCSSLTSIKIPENIRTISSEMFKNCSSLKNIEISQNVTQIGYNAFEGTKWLEMKLEENPFVIINNLLIAVDEAGIKENVTIPDNVTSILSYVFSDYSNLSNIEIPESVINIGDNTFRNCENLKNVKVSENLKFIGETAFRNCKNLTGIELPKSILAIGEGAFDGCDNLTIYGYKNSKAEEYAKEYEIPFVDVEEKPLPATPEIEQTPNADILASSSPEKVTPTPIQETIVPTETPIINSTGTENNNLVVQDIATPIPTQPTQSTLVPITELTPSPEVTDNSTSNIPEKNSILTDTKNSCKVKVISNSVENLTVAYTENTNDKSGNITIPATVKVDGITYKVTTVDANALSGNKKITKITIGKNVTTISKNAFKKCNKLKNITVKSQVLGTVGSNALKGTNKKLVIKVPKSKVVVYKKMFKGKGNAKLKIKTI